MEGQRRFRAFGLVLGGVIALLLVFVVGLRSGIPGVEAQQGPVMRVVGDRLGPQTVSVAVIGENLTNVGGFEFDLDVDPKVAQVVGAQVGRFLGASGRTVGALGPVVGAQRQTVGFGGYSYDPSGNNAAGPDGNGTLAQVTLKVIADGVAPLTLRNPILADVRATPQQVTTVNAALQVRTHHPGWNYMAPCIDTTRMSVTETLQSMDGTYDIVLGEQGTFVSGVPSVYQTLDSMPPPGAYWVRVTANTSVVMTQVAPQYDPTTPITLTKGWHWLGYCLRQSLPISVALQSIAGRYDLILGERGTYVVGLPEPYQSLRQMHLGEGYLIRMTADGTLVYPPSAPRTVTSPQRGAGRATSGACRAVSITPYMRLVYGKVYVNGSPAPVGTLVEAVTPRGEVAGCFEVRHAGYFGVMQVYGEDPEANIPGFRGSENMRWRVNGAWATGTPAVVWMDDKALVEVTLNVDAPGTGTSTPMFLPIILK